MTTLLLVFSSGILSSTAVAVSIHFAIMTADRTCSLYFMILHMLLKYITLALLLIIFYEYMSPEKRIINTVENAMHQVMSIYDCIIILVCFD